MDTRFLVHNSHREGAIGFRQRDPQLRHLAVCPFLHRSPLLDRLPDATVGIYTLSGGRQTGKSTLLKQWVAELLERGTPPNAITYLTGELIDDHHGLMLHLHTHLDEAPATGVNTLIVDEVTYIRDWDKAIKFAADAGLLERTVVVTGSDLVFMQEARMRFPGRRGPAPVSDFHLHPLSFREFLSLVGGIERLDELAERPVAAIDAEVIDQLYRGFDRYLLPARPPNVLHQAAVRGRCRLRARGSVLARGDQVDKSIAAQNREADRPLRQWRDLEQEPQFRRDQRRAGGALAPAAAPLLPLSA